MPAKKTPPMYARGRYVLIAPWDADIVPTKLYRTIAIRSFKDIYEDGLDVEEQFYTPKGLIDGQLYAGSPFSFQEEKDALANIITLISDDGQFIYVPDTYIASYPDMSDVKYSQVIVSFNFGAIPDYHNLNAIKTAMANLAASNIGIIPEVNEHRAPSANTPSGAQHDAIEAARLGAITNRETDYVKWKKLEAKIVQMQATIDAQTQILEDNGWLPT